MRITRLGRVLFLGCTLIALSGTAAETQAPKPGPPPAPGLPSPGGPGIPGDPGILPGPGTGSGGIGSGSGGIGTGSGGIGSGSGGATDGSGGIGNGAGGVGNIPGIRGTGGTDPGLGTGGATALGRSGIVVPKSGARGAALADQRTRPAVRDRLSPPPAERNTRSRVRRSPRWRADSRFAIRCCAGGDCATAPTT
jgi:hypothetical protein